LRLLADGPAEPPDALILAPQEGAKPARTTNHGAGAPGSAPSCGAWAAEAVALHDLRAAVSFAAARCPSNKSRGAMTKEYPKLDPKVVTGESIEDAYDTHQWNGDVLGS